LPWTKKLDLDTCLQLTPKGWVVKRWGYDPVFEIFGVSDFSLQNCIYYHCVVFGMLLLTAKFGSAIPLGSGNWKYVAGFVLLRWDSKFLNVLYWVPP
jgi:hypothetical protein